MSVQAGTTLGVLGPNGAGKTTLLKSMPGLLPLLGGGRVLPQGRQPRIGYVPQRDRLDMSWPLTVLDVVMMGRTGLLGPLERPRPKDRDRCLAALGEIGIGSLASRPLHALSGGQHQKVLIARAIAADPELVVLDEPTSAMDPAAERVILELVERPHRGAPSLGRARHAPAHGGRGFFKELLFVSYDPETATVLGVGVFRYELLLNVTRALVISVATRAVGALPVFAFTVIPAAAALMITERLGRTIALALAFGITAAAVGYYVSWVEELPTGASMVLVASVFLVPGLARLVRRKSV